MNFPPMLAVVRITGESNFNLYLPLFLLWPFLILLAPFLLIALVIFYKGDLKNLGEITWHSLALLASTRGTTIDVNQPTQKVLVTIK